MSYEPNQHPQRMNRLRPNQFGNEFEDPQAMIDASGQKIYNIEDPMQRGLYGTKPIPDFQNTQQAMPENNTQQVTPKAQINDPNLMDAFKQGFGNFTQNVSKGVNNLTQGISDRFAPSDPNYMNYVSQAAGNVADYAGDAMNRTTAMASELKDNPLLSGFKDWAGGALKVAGYGLLGAGMGYGGASPAQISGVFKAGEENYMQNNPNSPLSQQMQRLIKGYGQMYKDDIAQTPELQELFSQDVSSLPASALAPYYQTLSQLHSQKLAEKKYNALYGGDIDAITQMTIARIENAGYPEDVKNQMIAAVMKAKTRTDITDISKQAGSGINQQAAASTKAGIKQETDAEKQQGLNNIVKNMVSQGMISGLDAEGYYNQIKNTFGKGLDILEKDIEDKKTQFNKQQNMGIAQHYAQKNIIERGKIQEKLKNIDKVNNANAKDIEYNRKISLEYIKKEISEEKAISKKDYEQATKYAKEITDDRELLNNIDNALNVYKKELEGATYKINKGWVDKNGTPIPEFRKRNFVAELQKDINPNSKVGQFGASYTASISDKRHARYAGSLTPTELGQANIEFFGGRFQTIGEQIYYLKQLKEFINEQHELKKTYYPQIRNILKENKMPSTNAPTQNVDKEALKKQIPIIPKLKSNQAQN
jgi:hypothetical protein